MMSLGWQDDALCAETDIETFTPERGDHASTARAQRICGMCSVTAQCLEYALANKETFGVWGGLSPKQRRKLMSDRVA